MPIFSFHKSQNLIAFRISKRLTKVSDNQQSSQLRFAEENTQVDWRMSEVCWAVSLIAFEEKKIGESLWQRGYNCQLLDVQTSSPDLKK